MPARRRNLLINLALWLAPLITILAILTSIPRHEIKLDFINAQGTGIWAVPAKSHLITFVLILLAAAIVAILTHRKLAFLAGISFVLFALSTFMWARSHHRTDQYSYFQTSPAPGGRNRIAHEIKSTSGGFRWMRFAYDPRNPKLIFWETWIPEPFPTMLSGKSSDPPGSQYPSLDFPERHQPSRLRDLGFDLTINPPWARNRFAAESTSIVAAPYWFLCLCCLPLPLVWARQHHRRRRLTRRQRQGECANCGYDLRATPERCPECGHKVLAPSGHSGRC